MPTIGRNVYIPRVESVGGGRSSEGLLPVNLRVFRRLIDRDQVFDTIQTVVGCRRRCKRGLLEAESDAAPDRTGRLNKVHGAAILAENRHVALCHKVSNFEQNIHVTWK